MSKHETWMTRKYWNSIGGLLIEEFKAVNRSNEQSQRLIDGVIVIGKEKKIHNGNTFDIKGKDVIIIQTKARRIGMYLLGQAYFSKFLIEKFEPKSIRSVALCIKDDAVMNKLAERHEVTVVVISTDEEKLITDHRKSTEKG